MDTRTTTSATAGGATAHTDRPREAPEPFDPRRWRTLWLLLVGPFLSLLDAFCVNLAAVTIDRSLGLTAFEFQAVAAGYGLVYGLGLITGGRIGDLIGRRRAYRLGLALFALTSLACGLATSPGMLIAARLAQGAAAAVMLPQVLALIRIRFPAAERPKALSWYAVSMSLGMVAGQLLGGALPAWDLAGLGWRPVFLLAVPLCLLAYAGTGRSVPADAGTGAHRGRGLDLGGVALSALAFTLLLLPLAAARQLPLATGLALSGAGAVTSTLFVRHQRARHTRELPVLLPVQLFRVRPFTLGVLLTFTLYVATVPFFVLLGLYLQEEGGLGPAAAGLAFTPVAVGIGVGARLGVALRARFGPALLVGSGLCTAAGLGLALWSMAALSAHASLAPLLCALAVFGLGNGTSVPLVADLVLSRVPAEDSGAGSGVLTSAQQLGAAAGVALTGVLLFPATEGASLHYVPAMWLVLGAALLATVCAALLVPSGPGAAARAPSTRP
ncbi:MFS transporter [Streptomyces boluensis]|uniref:MFS transporter n=1 Tax=Streptomyces boluensis TaxID=1775135 RepID=A0A964XLV4_9ACTN|nr:MFS transporter [Streptomyces boluensis]NBE53874.1 MFS transporter [Streptomyces boluensis]